MTWSTDPVVTALIIGFVVLAIAGGLVRRKSGKKRDGTVDSTSWWLSSEADGRHQSGHDNVSRDDPGVGSDGHSGVDHGGSDHGGDSGSDSGGDSGSSSD